MKTLLFLGGIGWPEILVILLVLLLLFGGKKIPELMRGLGKGVRSFKEGMKEDDEVQSDDSSKKTEEKKSSEDKTTDTESQK